LHLKYSRYFNSPLDGGLAGMCCGWGVFRRHAG
jgi:hypothetical protein